jgi:hypothetical protein
MIEQIAAITAGEGGAARVETRRRGVSRTGLLAKTSGFDSPELKLVSTRYSEADDDMVINVE